MEVTLLREVYSIVNWINVVNETLKDESKYLEMKGDKM